MKYNNIIEGIFEERPNRFVAIVTIEGEKKKVHVKNTGRCKELLLPGTKVYLEDFRKRMGNRKLEFSLIGVEKNGKIVNMDSQVPNYVVEEALTKDQIDLGTFGKAIKVEREKTWGDSRLDLLLTNEDGELAYMEVKGVTLENDGHSMFPDAPTERGIKHLEELIKIRNAGFGAFVLFLIQMDWVKTFSPNYEMHKAFGEKLKEASEAGVGVLAYNCNVTENTILIKEKVEISL